MTANNGSAFAKIGRWELEDGGDDLPPAMAVLETITERPSSAEVLAECGDPGCQFSGAAEKYENRNTYWICPDCGSEAMIPQGNVR